MKFTAALASLSLLFVPIALAQTSVSVSYDNTYDNSAESLNDLACSNGPNGLEHLGYNYLGELPDFPYVGGSFAVTGWDSTGCGTCWEITYDGTTITVLAVDTASEGFNLSEEAMNALTNGQAEFLGRVTATAVQVDASQSILAIELDYAMVYFNALSRSDVQVVRTNWGLKKLINVRIGDPGKTVTYSDSETRERPMSLPPPSRNQAWCDVSALEAGHVEIPLPWILDTASAEDTSVLPALSFLFTHSVTGATLLFDLGVRRDWERLPPAIVHRIRTMPFHINVPQDVAESLRAGGADPAQIQTVCISHIHLDHYGDTTPFTGAKFIVGGASRSLFEPGYPADPNSVSASDLLPQDRTEFLEIDDAWKPIGPFPRALDFYGDGSLYLVDAPGHLPGHLNALVRTSPDGGWVYLAGDSAHDWRLIHGEAQIARTDRWGCAHVDVQQAKVHFGRIKELQENRRVRVILAHDTPWYEENKGGQAFWPGKISSP
ncbi:Cerato-platanin-domain-containing protein [Sparassis latifolia]